MQSLALSLMLMGISSFIDLKDMIHNETKLTNEEIEKTADSIMEILYNGLFKQ